MNNQLHDSVDVDLLLQYAYSRATPQNIVWQHLYIAKVRGTSSMVDTLVELIRLLPPMRGYVPTYNARMDKLIESIALTTEEKTAIAQSMLDQIFSSEATAEKYPFPLSFVNWAIDSGANLGQLDQYAVLLAIIDNEVLRLDSTNTVKLPLIIDIDLNILQGGFLQGIDQQRVLQEAEARGGAEYKAAAEEVMEMLKISP